jgi:hypothetical protein
MFFAFPEDARWNADRQAVEFGVEIDEYSGVVRFLVFQRLSPSGSAVPQLTETGTPAARPGPAVTACRAPKRTSLVAVRWAVCFRKAAIYLTRDGLDACAVGVRAASTRKSRIAARKACCRPTIRWPPVS